VSTRILLRLRHVFLGIAAAAVLLACSDILGIASFSTATADGGAGDGGCQSDGGVPALASVDLVTHVGAAYDGRHLCDLYALNLDPDSTRTLVSFTFSVTGGDEYAPLTSYFAFYGATAR
jgi:hypothetical protein